MRESGCIDLSYPFVKSWIWEKPNNTVIMSMVIVHERARRRGNCTKLVRELKERYDRIIVPDPSDALVSILRKNGFLRASHSGNTWEWNR